MKDFTFNVPQDIIFGKGSLKRLPELLEKSGSKKMLLISGPVLKKIGMVEKVEEIVKASGIEVEVFTDVEANPSVATVDKATEAYKKAGATSICLLYTSEQRLSHTKHQQWKRLRLLSKERKRMPELNRKKESMQLLWHQRQSVRCTSDEMCIRDR